MRIPLRAALLLFCVAVPSLPAISGTLRCTSVNGNVNCVGSNAVSCQTVNGRTICTGPGVAQSFGDPGDEHDDEEQDATTPHRIPWRDPS